MVNTRRNTAVIVLNKHFNLASMLDPVDGLSCATVLGVVNVEGFHVRFHRPVEPKRCFAEKRVNHVLFLNFAAAVFQGEFLKTFGGLCGGEGGGGRRVWCVVCWRGVGDLFVV